MQVQLTTEQAQALRKLAAAEGQSVAALVRRGVDLYLSKGTSEEERDRRQREKALGLLGKFSSEYTDVATNHDEHLAEIFKDW